MQKKKQTTVFLSGHYPPPAFNTNVTNCFLLLLLVCLSACGAQKRLFEAQHLAAAARENTENEKALLDSISEKTTEKFSSAEIDSVIKDEYTQILLKLNQQLKEAEGSIARLEEFTKNRRNFKQNHYVGNVAAMVQTIDSFNVLKEKRERIYQFINDAIAIKAFNLYNLAGFFEPGVYRIPSTESGMINRNFAPAIDSISSLSNKYADIPRMARLVFVGYADESQIEPTSRLYLNLRRYSVLPDPNRKELNRILSQLRAGEMTRNMKMVIARHAQKFNHQNRLQFTYFSYGRGELYPSLKIKDYKPNDERRRIVMFYWAVLPDIDYIDAK